MRRRHAVELVDNVFKVRPCYHQLVAALIKSGVWSLEADASPGTPIQPMTANPARDIDEVIVRLEGRGKPCDALVTIL